MIKPSRILCFALTFFFTLPSAFAQGWKEKQERDRQRFSVSMQEIMSRNHIHRRYHKYPPVDEPVKWGMVEIGEELYEQWQGPTGWYYCYPQDGECFDRRGYGVDPTGTCWVNKARECVSSGDERDVSNLARHFRIRGDLGPPINITSSIYTAAFGWQAVDGAGRLSPPFTYANSEIQPGTLLSHETDGSWIKAQDGMWYLIAGTRQYVLASSWIWNWTQKPPGRLCRPM